MGHLPLPPEEEIQQIMDRATPFMEAYLDDVYKRQFGVSRVCHFGYLWNSVVIPREPYNARNRKRWSDKLIPE